MLRRFLMVRANYGFEKAIESCDVSDVWVFMLEKAWSVRAQRGIRPVDVEHREKTVLYTLYDVDTSLA